MHTILMSIYYIKVCFCTFLLRKRVNISKLHHFLIAKLLMHLKIMFSIVKYLFIPHADLEILVTPLQFFIHLWNNIGGKVQGENSEHLLLKITISKDFK